MNKRNKHCTSKIAAVLAKRRGGGVDQQLLFEGKRLPLSDEESLPLEKNRYTCFVAPADKSSSYKAKGAGSTNRNSRASQETK